MPSPRPRAVVRLIDREDADVGHAAEHVQLRERRHHGQQADHERKQGCDDAAEREHEQHHGDGYGNRLGEREVAADLPADVAADRGTPAGANRHGGGVDGVAVDQLGSPVVVVDVGQDQGAAPVCSAQRRDARGPVRHDAADSPLRSQAGGDGGAGTHRRRGVDAACSGCDEQHQVGTAAEAGVEQPLCPGALSGWVAEPSTFEDAERARTERTARDDRDDGECKDGAGMADGPRAEPGEHPTSRCPMLTPSTWHSLLSLSTSLCAPVGRIIRFGSDNFQNN